MDGVEEQRLFERFGKVRVHPRIQTALLVGLHGMGRERDDGQDIAAFPHDLDGFVAVHVRHLDIEEHEVESLAFQQGKGFDAVAGHLELGAGFFEQYGHDLLIDGVVLGYEDAHGRQIRRDRRLRRARPPEARFFPIKQLAEGGADAAHGDGRDDLDGIGLVLEFGDGEAFPRAAHKHKRDRGGAAQLQLRRKAQGRGAVPIAEQAIDDDEIRPERLLPQRGEDGKRAHPAGDVALALDAECLQRAAHDPDARIRRADHDRLQIHEGIAAEHFHLFLKRQPYGERERASLPDFRFDPDFPAHVFDHIPGDAQAEARAAVPPGQRGVGLFERLEQLRQLIRGDADTGVVHEEQELRLILVFGKVEVAAVPDLQVDAPARRREFDGVAHQVGQDLLQAPRIAEKRQRRGGIDVDQAFQLTRHAAAHGHIANAQDHFIKHERGGVRVHFARFDLGEVQRVVDDVEQGVGQVQNRALMVARQRVVFQVG